jgi:RNA polymerase sigma-70 factor (ECF subfamily)
MNELTEREAVERCQRGDPGHVAFRFLYEKFSSEVFGFLKHMLRDRETAEDTCQETFLRLHKGLANFDSTRPLRPYVLQVARNVAIDVIRVRKKRGQMAHDVDEDLLPNVAPREADEANTNECREIVGEALSALGPESRTLLALRFVHELSYDELAHIEKCTSRTIGNRLRAAVELLSRELVRRGAHNLEVRP